MSGLQKILKIYGRMIIGGVLWVWDYANERPVIRAEMSKEEWAASERAKYMSPAQP